MIECLHNGLIRPIDGNGFPQFSRLLPYRDYNQESGLFMNDTTMGFM
ncbi:TraC family protein, partial [Enterobacter hormaechei subsp. steigerwaltii]|nr:TraC family protein [Enterobacter hormaechei subsp. steigerwaltii]